MTSRAPLFELLNAKLLDIEAALLSHQPDMLATACQAFTKAMGDVSLLAANRGNQPLLSKQDTVELDQKFKQLRQAILQQSAANDRVLESLLPGELLGGYGNKSAFGGARRSANLKSYQV